MMVVAIVLGFQTSAFACHQGPPPKEVSACWKIDNPDTSNDTAEFPQTFVKEGTAQDTAATLCPTSVPKCSDDAEYQFDKYWIRDEGDRNLLDSLEANGLTETDNRPADTPLEPHNYSDIVLLSSQDNCTPPPPKFKHASIKVHKLQSCARSDRTVWTNNRYHIRKVLVTHDHAKFNWTVRAWAGHHARFFLHQDGNVVMKKRFVRHVHLKHLGRCGHHHPTSG